MNNYKFNPLEHGYEPITNFPELEYEYPMSDGWFIKVTAIYEDKIKGFAYWYSVISTHLGLHGDDRIKIISSLILDNKLYSLVDG